MRWILSSAVGLGLLGCGPSVETSGEGSSSQSGGSTSTSTTTSPSGTSEAPSTAPMSDSNDDADVGDDSNDVSDHDCATDCCQDAVTFSVEDGRESFELQFEVAGKPLETLTCPAARSDAWMVSCEGASLTIDAGGGGVFNTALDNTVRLDGGDPQAFGDELGLSGCDCNCVPQEGDVTVLLDPTSGTTGSTGGSSSTGFEAHLTTSDRREQSEHEPDRATVGRGKRRGLGPRSRGPLRRVPYRLG